MIRNTMRSTRLLSWRYLRWAIAIPTLPLAWWACASHPLTQPVPEPEQQTDIYISVSPQRLLDLVFMVDNSPSMAPKVDKMNQQFLKLINALKDPSDGTLPDLHVAVIDSDLGTGGAYPDGTSCGRTASGSIYGDLGHFQMRTSPQACTFDSGAEFLVYTAGNPVNYTGDINTVFGCLASDLGTLGCGEEHQLQAFEFALVAHGVGNEQQQADFLRGNAYLGLVFLSDEDDCSAATMDRMFGDKDELKGESASLRCATRAHMCGGRNMSISPPGYPTDASYEHPFSDCEARMGDECPADTDTSVPTDCNPLKSVKTLADEMKGLKTDPDNQILVAGIFGWPRTDADMAKATYKVAPVPNPNTADTLHPTVYDYWPVCYDPNHMPSAANTDSATGFDPVAAGWGATGGLREAAFVDQFGDNGLKFSICEPDFTNAMGVIGNAIAKKLQNLCVDYKLIDTDGNSSNGVQADCRVVWRVPEEDPNHPGQVIYNESPTSMPQCDPSYSTNNPPPDCPDNLAANDPQRAECGDCWMLTHNTDKCPLNGQLIVVLRTASEIQKNKLVLAGTKVGMQCRTCTDFSDSQCAQDPNSTLCNPGCNYTL